MCLEFKVTPTSLLTDIEVEQSLTKQLDATTREIVLKGLCWIPAHKYGYVPIDGLARVEIEFK